MLKRGGKMRTKSIALERFVMLSMVLMSTLLTQSCALLKKSGNVETTPVEVVKLNNMEYWCLEKKDFTAVLQEADRCR